MFNFFAVCLDGFAAKMKLLCNFSRSISSAQELKHLHLTIGQTLDAGTRGNRFVAQSSLHHGCSDSVTEVQFARQYLAHRPQHLVSDVFLHYIAAGAGTERTLSENQLIDRKSVV